MDDTINITLKIPKSIISSSRELTIRILLKEDGESINDFVTTPIIVTNKEYLSDCTFDNWKNKLSQFLYSLAIREEKIISLITDAVDLAIKTNNPRIIFSRLAKNDRDLAKQMHNMIGNRMKTREVSRLIYETFERSFTPQHLVEYLYDIINSKIEDAS